VAVGDAAAAATAAPAVVAAAATDAVGEATAAVRGVLNRAALSPRHSALGPRHSALCGVRQQIASPYVKSLRPCTLYVCVIALYVQSLRRCLQSLLALT